MKLFTLDNLYGSLPRPRFPDEETDSVATWIYDFVSQSSSARAPLTATA